MFTASAVPRLLVCPGSHSLPHADYRTVHAVAGTARHEDMEAAIAVGDTSMLPPELLPAGAQLTTEAAFALDLSTGEARALGHINRKYEGLAPFEIVGTADLVIHAPGFLAVVDYKRYEEVDPADRNAQLATYGLMAARAAGVDEVVVAIVYTDAPRRPSIAMLDAFDLSIHFSRLRELHGRVHKERSFARSKHCKYCPGFLACPEQKALMIDADRSIPLRIETAIPFNDDADAADAFDLLERIKTLAKRIEAALYARAAERPFQLSDGREFGTRTVKGRESVDADVAYRAIREVHGQEIADKAVERKTSKAAIERAVGKQGVTLVRAAGGIVTGEPRTVVDVHEPLALAAAD